MYEELLKIALTVVGVVCLAWLVYAFYQAYKKGIKEEINLIMGLLGVLVGVISGFLAIPKPAPIDPNAMVNTPFASNPNEVAPTVTTPNFVPSSGSDSIATHYGIKMIFVQGGNFTMGCLPDFDDACEADEQPAHQIMLSSFYISQTEITQAQWKAVMGNNPATFAGCDNCPVENVSWDEVQKFIKKLNILTAKSYLLPSEAQWEYAARGGNKAARIPLKYAGTDSISNVVYYDNSGSKTQAVASHQANELGLYDMSGNVWEWCNDWYDEHFYTHSPRNNPLCSAAGALHRVVRGGSWYSNAKTCRLLNRFKSAPGVGTNDIGFRLVHP